MALALCRHARAVDASAIFDHAAGIWRIARAGSLNRWIIIHNLDEARRSGVFHIEVIGREHGKPAWAIQHLCDHMAITLEALERSALTPMNSGAVYPEAFDWGLRVWNDTPKAQRAICDTSVVACLPAAPRK